MDKIARLRQEIERRITDNTFGAKLELIDILAWLDTLSEEPDKSLEEAAEKHINEALFKWSYDDEDGIEQYVHDSFIAGAEWQARQLLQGSPMPEDTVLFQKGVAEGRRLEREDMMKSAVEWTVTTNLANRPVIYLDQLHGFEYGDKVRIVVLKAKEE